MNADSRPPARSSVPALIISVTAAVLLGLAAGAAVDRSFAGNLEPGPQFAAGLITAAVVAMAVGGLSYRALNRRNG